MISKIQIKAARAMLDWSQQKLADECGEVSLPTIKLIEVGKVNSTPSTLTLIKDVFENAGLEFLPQEGVRFRDNFLTILEKMGEGDVVYLKLMDDIYETVNKNPSEILFSFVDQSLSPDEVIDRQEMVRKTGSAMRFLVKHGDRNFRYPLNEYCYLPKGHYLTNPCVVYGDKFAMMVSGWEKVVIINDPDIARLKRKEFEIIWEYGEKPDSSDIKEKA